jgi:hypothetical protein
MSKKKKQPPTPPERPEVEADYTAEEIATLLKYGVDIEGDRSVHAAA